MAVHRNGPRGDDRGATIIVVLVMITALLGVAAFAVDLGLAWAVKRQLSSTADASALAGAQAAGLKYEELHPEGGGCKAGDLAAYTVAAASAVSQTHTANAPLGSTGTPTPIVTCSGASIDVRVDTASSLKTIFGGFLGRSSLDPAEYAIARVAGSPVYGGLRPFAVCIDDFPTDANQSLNNTYQTNFPQNKNDEVVCGTASGNFQLVDFDEGSNPTPDLKDWTRYGYDGAISFPTDIYGNPGASINPLAAELDYLVDNEIPILLPVFTGWLPGSSGNGALMAAPGVVSVRLCGWSKDPKKVADNTNSDCWDAAQYAAVKDEKFKLVLQWKYAAYIPGYQSSGNGSTACDLGQVLDPSAGTVPCKATMRLWE